ncbi:MAG: hypothetical protein H0X29_10770 [Parachlamydiaceae bacterium]|nr:hypothetical protein [Parachlamydiaceae bacterium]
MSVLSMRQFRQVESNCFDIEPAHLEIYAEGSWAIMERLHPLESRQWQTLSGDLHLHPLDTPLVNELSGLIGKSLKAQITPLNFAATALMYDHQFKIKALKPMKIQSLDFNALEDFAYACAGHNTAVFKQLMIKSGLFSHPIGKFYHELIKNALKGDQTSIDDMAGIYKIGDAKVVDRGIVLVKEVLALRDQMSLKMRHAHPEKEMKSILMEVNAKLMHSHHESKGCGRLSP